MAEWVTIVDDDVTNLKIAGHILAKQNFKVSFLKSGEALIDFLKDHRPDLILLDIHMPGMNGIETLKKIRSMEKEREEIPVIFLTADEDAKTEVSCLRLGAMDFIKKPFIPEVLLLRVRHILELVRLQRHLQTEVEIKTKEKWYEQSKNERLSMQIVKTLVNTIDAKDKYTKGHSMRVAEYSKEIARRMGYSKREQTEIYIMGILHDVGKIGIPDQIINKPGKLTEEEYEIIKIHPSVGEEILLNISELPKLSIGAKWHHERYDGKGYPDQLSGEEIPMEARIIAVADAYDAMTSRRSYRDILEQKEVRLEMERGIGRQFDARAAEIMMEMIDEDQDYQMCEKSDTAHE